jgi:hypothetical protein
LMVINLKGFLFSGAATGERNIIYRYLINLSQGEE